jgi:hypothetical protein
MTGIRGKTTLGFADPLRIPSIRLTNQGKAWLNVQVFPWSNGLVNACQVLVNAITRRVKNGNIYPGRTNCNFIFGR